MKPVLLILIVVIFVSQENSAADLDSPVDRKLRTTYQRIHFGQQYPHDAVEFIQTQLQDAQKPHEVMAQLAKSDRLEVRTLVAQLLGEYGEVDSADPLWLLTRDQLESVRLTAAGALVRLSVLTHVPIKADGLQDERAEVRRLTAGTLGALADKGAEEPLIDALSDENELVRTDVVKALNSGACGTPKSTAALIEMFHDPNVNVRTSTAANLGGRQDPSVIEPLIAALKDSDWHVRAAAAESLRGWVKNGDAVIGPLLKVMESDDFALVRDRAADALSHATADDRVVVALVKAIGAEQRDVRFHAAQSIIVARAMNALPLLAEYRQDPNPEVRAKVMEIIGYLGGPEQLAIIIEGSSDAEPQVQYAAVNALRRMKESGATGQLVARLNDPSPHIRAAAARALGDLGEKSAGPGLLSLLKDDSGYVRSAAAEALGKLGDSTAIAPLISVLTGEKIPPELGKTQGLVIGTGAQFIANLELTELQQRTRAVEALGVLRAKDAVGPIIEKGLKSQDATLRAVSAFALGQIGDSRATEPLQDAVRPYYAAAQTADNSPIFNEGASKVSDDSRRQREKESRVRASVAWALGQIGDSTAKETLLKAANDPNSLVRDAALEALARISDKQEAKQLAATETPVPTVTQKPLPTPTPR